MITQSNDIPADGVDPKTLSSLIIELNIARRNSLAYPKGHPSVASSLLKVLRIYENLLDIHEEFILGVTSDALMVSGVTLEKTNLVYRDFSRVLFERGIGALVFQRGLTIGELTNFISILGLKREQINQYGGIEQLWSKAGISSLLIRPIRYDIFQTSDEDSVTTDLDSASGEGVWDKFARELTLGELPYGNDEDVRFDPEILAEVLNQQFADGAISTDEVRRAISDLLAPTALDSSLGTLSGKPYQKLAAFINNLTPELRRQFLDSSFRSKSHGRQNAAEQIINNLSSITILETLEDINRNLLNVSPAVFDLLQRLGRNVTQSRIDNESDLGGDDLSTKMKTLFREHPSEEFVPDDYQKKLSMIIASDEISRFNMEEVTDLLHTTESSSIESSIGQILMNLIRDGVETPEERDLLLQNLSDMFGLYLQTGDYGQLLMMMHHLTDDTFPLEIQDLLRKKYSQRVFLEEILDGLTVWGKPRYGDIRSLITMVGSPFVEAILDRLAEEKNMSLRRFYMDCLIEMDSLAKEPVIARITDKRWYFQRNLLIILTAINDPAVVPNIRPLLRTNEHRLRLEVMRTLVHFRD
ncbi:MAG: hypothetical protein PHI31_00700, partial [Desulfuromonadaceae bacterium]|nr:hypothetical protein [Desulfuromonadaceae bacterium]